MRRACGLAGGRDPWRGLRGQKEVELPDEELLVGVQLGVAAEDQRAVVGGGKVNVKHLDGGELVEHGPGGEPGCQRFEPGAQGDVKAIGDEGDKDVRFDSLDQLVIDRAQLQIVLEIFEGRLDLDQLDVELPQLRGVLPHRLVRRR